MADLVFYTVSVIIYSMMLDATSRLCNSLHIFVEDLRLAFARPNLWHQIPVTKETLGR